ncbi:type II secretion system protein E, partial [Candidatus Halobonum tyrrellensis G22]
PASADLGPEALSTLDAARRRLADGSVDSRRPPPPGRAVRAAAGDDDPVEELTRVLRKHTRGNGLLDDLFADPRLTDAYLTAPVATTPLRVTVDGESLTTNVRFSRADAETLASRVRAESGRAFSRASPTADATLDGVRVAGVTDPASDGPAFAFRRADDDPWTLARLVAAGSLPAR